MEALLLCLLIIRTNQQSLRYIQEQKLTEGIQHKLLVKLLGYNYSIEYKKGNTNRVADALSRVKHKIQSLLVSTTKPAWIMEVTDTYKNDNKCKDLLTQVSVDPTALPNYTLQNGILRFKNRVVIGNNKTLQEKINSFLAQL